LLLGHRPQVFASLNLYDSSALAPIHRSVYSACDKCVEELVQIASVDLNQTDGNGRTPLHLTADLLRRHPGQPAFAIIYDLIRKAGGDI
jgi:hypothetical protein